MRSKLVPRKIAGAAAFPCAGCSLYADCLGHLRGHSPPDCSFAILVAQRIAPRLRATAARRGPPAWVRLPQSGALASKPARCSASAPACDRHRSPREHFSLAAVVTGAIGIGMGVVRLSSRRPFLSLANATRRLFRDYVHAPVDGRDFEPRDRIAAPRSIVTEAFVDTTCGRAFARAALASGIRCPGSKPYAAESSSWSSIPFSDAREGICRRCMCRGPRNPS